MKTTKIELEALQAYIKITPPEHRDKTFLRAYTLGWVLSAYNSLQNELTTLKSIKSCQEQN